MTLAPPLKWVGGKRWQVPHLLPLWAPHARRRVVEPFCGGLSVSLGLHPSSALLNDINPALVSFYLCIKAGLEIQIDMRNDAELYYQHRKRFNTLLATLRDMRATSGLITVARLECASLCYYLNRTGFNGLCRFNSRGEYNVPFGRYKTIAYRRTFEDYRDQFSGWAFTSLDFEQLALEPHDFVYADPPYDATFAEFTADGFTWDDQVRLAEWLARHPGPVVATNQGTRRIAKLYRSLGFALRYLDAPRRISRNGNREPVREVLATRNL